MTAALSVAPIIGAADRGVSDSIPSGLASGAVVRGWMEDGVAMTFRREAVSDNPAAMSSKSPFSATRIGLEGEISDTGHTLPAEIGEGVMSGSVVAESYRHLGSATTVWGHARFNAGKIKDVEWNNSADYELVGPYVIGDPVGGDLTGRSYDFGGGYAGMSGRWMWGVAASYRAAIDYRGRDPRDKIIVSDLNASAGGGFRPGNSPLAVGLSGSVRVYNQNAAIEFYNPVNDIPTYAMTGLGTYYPRFSGNSGRNTAYSGVGFGLSASLFPVGSRLSLPVRGGIDVSRIRLRQYMRDFNNLELTHTSTTSVSGEYAMLMGDVNEAACALTYGFELRGEYRVKTGTENLLGSSTGNNYPKIGERDNYRKALFNAGLTVPLEMRFSANDRAGVSAGVSFGSVSERVTEPSRKVSASGITPTIGGKWGHRFPGGSFLTIRADFSRRFTSVGTVSLSALDSDTSLGDAVMRDIALLTSDVTSYGVEARVEVPLVDSAAVYVRVQWRREDFARRCGSADYATLSVGIHL